MYNAHSELTEASSSNVFIVKDGVVTTPMLDNQILPGISRHIVVESLREEVIDSDGRAGSNDGRSLPSG